MTVITTSTRGGHPGKRKHGTKHTRIKRSNMEEFELVDKAKILEIIESYEENHDGKTPQGVISKFSWEDMAQEITNYVNSL